MKKENKIKVIEAILYHLIMLIIYATLALLNIRVYSIVNEAGYHPLHTISVMLTTLFLGIFLIKQVLDDDKDLEEDKKK